MSSPEVLSYVAGFLDGDGCINVQLVRRKDYRLGYQIRPSVTFFQKQKHRAFLEWLQSVFQAGYIRERKDGMSEYSVVDVKSVDQILAQLRPYIRLKQRQCDLVLEIVAELKHSSRLSPQDFLTLARKVDVFEELNDSKKRTIKSSQVAEFMGVQHILIP
ncbi:site-specific DNA endonuclease [Gloeomargarita lithophora Alchichica-D10]|uniref:Site-specific DNA endonuclease n=1 Tax=Gloeomargarita lithophora Alchichica-D10 TaxID=1188229 RepID=A0A1J0AAY6_9CYAN|nr:site-specific DNA endonuclease [Gloeomargarita lithophora Alchichica-D10]